MNTVQLECFLAVAQYLNFSKAAESVSITQPRGEAFRANEQERFAHKRGNNVYFRRRADT